MKSIVIILCFTFMGLGIASAQDENEPTATDPFTELEKVNAAFTETWVHPDADFTQFSKIFLWDGEFQYRDVGPARRTRLTMMSTRKREFGISDADRQKFEQVVSEAFDQEIQKGKKFTIVDELGPNTMILRGAALDIISNVPPDTIGPSDIYLSSIGEATLVLELLDAATGDVLAVVAERRRLGGYNGGFAMPTSPVTVLSDVRRWARGAAAKLRSELDKAIASN